MDLGEDRSLLLLVPEAPARDPDVLGEPRLERCIPDENNNNSVLNTNSLFFRLNPTK